MQDTYADTDTEISCACDSGEWQFNKSSALCEDSQKGKE